jgi:hypothetical protein
MSLGYSVDPQLSKDGVGGTTGEQTTRDKEVLHGGNTILHLILLA